MPALFRTLSQSARAWAQRRFHKQLYQNTRSRAAFTLWGQVLKETRVSGRQFFSWSAPLASGLRVLKYGLVALVRLPLGRSLRFSYGYTGEDQLLVALLKPLITHNGFYVEVGSNEPRFISNTFLLYRRGWRGICIDPNAELIRKHRRIRPRDQAVCALVSHETQSLTYIQLSNNVLSTATSQAVPQLLAEGQYIVGQQEVQPRSLTSILEEARAPARFDLLAVDAEGFDLSVLQSLDFQRFRPRLVLAEADDFDPAQPQQHAIFQLLVAQGYVFQGSILTNLYFLYPTEAS